MTCFIIISVYTTTRAYYHIRTTYNKPSLLFGLFLRAPRFLRGEPRRELGALRLLFRGFLHCSVFVHFTRQRGSGVGEHVKHGEREDW